MNTVIQLRPSRSEKPTVRGGRAKNTDYRQREYLTEAEIDKLMAAAGEKPQSWPRFRLAIKDMRKFGSKEEIAKTLRFAVDVLEGRGGAGVFRDWPPQGARRPNPHQRPS
jgi:hypothetical protein